MFWKTVELCCDINFPTSPPPKTICFDNRNFFRHSLPPVPCLIPFLSIFEHFHTPKTLNLPLHKKMFTYGAFSGPYFPVLGLNTECPHTELFLIRVFLYLDWIQTRKNSVFEHFLRNVYPASGWGEDHLRNTLDTKIFSFYLYRTHALAFSNFYNVQRKNFENLTYYFCTLV